MAASSSLLVPGIALGTSSTGAVALDGPPPGIHLSRDSLLCHRPQVYAEAQQHGHSLALQTPLKRSRSLEATDSAHSPLSCCRHSALLRKARKIRRQSAVHRDRSELALLRQHVVHLEQTPNIIEKAVVVEIPIQKHTAEICIQTDDPDVAKDVSVDSLVADDVSGVMPKMYSEDDVLKLFEDVKKDFVTRSQVAEFLASRDQKISELMSEITLKDETVALLKGKLEASTYFQTSCKDKILEQRCEIDSLKAKLTAVPPSPTQSLLLPNLADEMCKIKGSFAGENSALRAEVQRLKHDIVILQDELAEAREDFDSEDQRFDDDD